MSRHPDWPNRKGDGWCGGVEGVTMAFVRGGPKRRKSRRERKWERERSHRRRRQGWARWPKMGWPGYTYFLRPEALSLDAGVSWLEPGMAADFEWKDGPMEFRAVDKGRPGGDKTAVVTGVSHEDGTVEITAADTCEEKA